MNVLPPPLSLFRSSRLVSVAFCPDRLALSEKLHPSLTHMLDEVVDLSMEAWASFSLNGISLCAGGCVLGLLAEFGRYFVDNFFARRYPRLLLRCKSLVWRDSTLFWSTFLFFPSAVSSFSFSYYQPIISADKGA